MFASTHTHSFRWAGLWALLALCAFYAVMLMTVVRHPHTTNSVENDVIPVFRQLDEGRSILAPQEGYRHPIGLKAVLWTLNLVTGSSFVSGRILCGVSAIGTIVLVYLLFRLLLPPPFPFAISVLTALHPGFLSSAVFVNTDAPWQCLQTAALACCVWALSRDSWRRYAVAGAVLGLAYIIRYPSIITVPVMILCTVAVGWARKQFRESLLWCVSFCATFLLVASPQIGLNYRDFGRFQPTQADMIEIAIADSCGVDESRIPLREDGSMDVPSQSDSMAGVILANPARFLRHYVSNVSALPRLLASMCLDVIPVRDMLYYPQGLVAALLLLVVGAGLGARWAGGVPPANHSMFWREARADIASLGRVEWVFLLLFTLAYVLSVSLFFVTNERYFIVALPVLLALILLVVRIMVRRDQLVGVFVAVCVGWGLLNTYRGARGIERWHETVFEVGAALDQAGATVDDVVLSPYPMHYDYNLNRSSKRFQFEKVLWPATLDLPSLEKTLGEERPRFLLWNHAYGYTHEPQFMRLFDPASAPPYLKPLYLGNPGPESIRCVLYEIDYGRFCGP